MLPAAAGGVGQRGPAWPRGSRQPTPKYSSFKCDVGGEWKPLSAFSLRNQKRVGRPDFDPADSGMTCRTHSEEAIMEIQCEGPCNEVLPLNRFSKSTRVKKIYWCLRCQAWADMQRPGRIPLPAPGHPGDPQEMEMEIHIPLVPEAFTNFGPEIDAADDPDFDLSDEESIGGVALRGAQPGRPEPERALAESSTLLKGFPRGHNTDGCLIQGHQQHQARSEMSLSNNTFYQMERQTAQGGQPSLAGQMTTVKASIFDDDNPQNAPSTASSIIDPEDLKALKLWHPATSSSQTHDGKGTGKWNAVHDRLAEWDVLRPAAGNPQAPHGTIVDDPEYHVDIQRQGFFAGPNAAGIENRTSNPYILNLGRLPRFTGYNFDPDSHLEHDTL